MDPCTRVHRKFVKPAGSPWNNRASYSNEEQKIVEDYLTNCIRVQTGYNGTYETTYPEENTMIITYNIDHDSNARGFVKNITDLNNPYFKAMHDMLQIKKVANQITDYQISTEIEFFNGDRETVTNLHTNAL
jgi:uncharacterized membrane protein